jgi:plasmid maintenance system antidote protein VapI
MIDPKFLTIVRATIAAKQIPKKSLAHSCGVSKPRFSEMLHGDREMSCEVKAKLVKELGLDEIRRKWAEHTSGTTD